MSEMVYQVANAVKIPVVGMGGVSSAENVIEMTAPHVSESYDTKTYLIHNVFSFKSVPWVRLQQRRIPQRWK